MQLTYFNQNISQKSISLDVSFSTFLRLGYLCLKKLPEKNQSHAHNKEGPTSFGDEE